MPLQWGEIVLVVRDSLFVKEMDNNPIPSFIMREAGVTVNEVPKIHVYDPSVEDHAVIFRETGFRIPLSLHGIFSCFTTSKPSVNDLNEIDQVYLLSPPSWNPHNISYAENESSFLGRDGELVERRRDGDILLSDSC